MPGDRTNAFISVLIAGGEVQGDVVSVEVEDGDRAIDQATIVLDDPADRASSPFREGATVKIDMGWQNDHQVMFEGLVRRVTVDSQARLPQRVTIEAYDLSYRLQGDPHSAEFTGTLSSILQRLIAPATIAPGQIEPSPDRNYTTTPLRQTNRRDWDFIQDIARLENSRAFVEYNEGASKFYFLPASRLMSQNLGTLQYNCGLSRLREFRYQRTASAASPQRTVDANDPVSGDPIQQRPTPAVPEAPPLPDPENLQRQTARGTAASYVQAHVANASANPDSQRRGSRAAGVPDSADRAEQEARQDPTRRLGFVGEGSAVGNCHIRAKGVVTIEGIPTWAAGDWYVAQVNHRYERVIEQGQVQAGRETRARSSYTTRIRVTR